MKTTIDNYKERIAQVDISAMPGTLQKGHSQVIKDQAKGFRMYKKNDTIKRVFELYFSKLDEYIEKQSQAQGPAYTWAPREMNTSIVSSGKKEKKQAHAAKKEQPITLKKIAESLNLNKDMRYEGELPNGNFIWKSKEHKKHWLVVGADREGEFYLEYQTPQDDKFTYDVKREPHKTTIERARKKARFIVDKHLLELKPESDEPGKVVLPEPEWAITSNIQKRNKDFDRQKKLAQWVFDHIGKEVSLTAIKNYKRGYSDRDLETPFTPILKKIYDRFQTLDKTGYKRFKIEASKNTREALAALLSNYAFDTVKYNEENDCFAVNFPISSIHTDTARFQNRKDAFSEISAQAVADNFDANKFDPIVVWIDPKDAKTYVISGHSRLEGMKRRKAKAIPVRYFSGTEKQAIQFSKVEANRSQNVENLVEDIQAYKLLRDGDKSKGIEPKTKKEIRQVFNSKTASLEQYSFLNPKGLFMQALSQENQTEFPYLERTARWVGELRNKYSDRITNLMEDNCFNFFYADKQGKNAKLAKDQFIDLVEKRLDTMTSKERLLFTQDGQTVSKAKQMLEDKLKGEGYKRLKEINELKRFISDRLKTTDRKLKVWTEAEEDYLRNTLSKKLDEEKKRIERDLDYLDDQQSLFGLAGCDCQVSKKRRGRPRGSKDKQPRRRKPRRRQKNVGLHGIKDLNDMVPESKPKPAISEQSAENEPIRASEVPASKEDQKPNLLNDIAHLFQSGKHDQERPTFTLPGNVGKFLGRIEQYEYALALRGDKGAGKSTLAYRLMNSAAQWGMQIAFMSLEMSPRSAVFQQMLDKFIEPENQAKIKATDEVDTLEKLEKVAASGHFDMIVIDSWTKLREIRPQHFDHLRKKFPDIIWIVIFQSTTGGTARSGYMAEYDAQAVVQVNAQPVRGTAIMEKNRYSDGIDYTYNVFTDQISEDNQDAPNPAGRLSA